jgi:hypothetical protein
MWFILWTILMIFWLLYGGYVVYQTPADPARPGPVAYGGIMFPWLCVLILGLVVFGVVGGGGVGIVVK